MNPRHRYLTPAAAMLAGWLALAGVATAATVEPIMAPAQRATALERARGLLAPKTAPAKVANPFFTEAFGDVMAGGRDSDASDSASPGVGSPRPEPAGPRSGRDLLQSIALSLKPSGFFVFGGVPHLSFGQKRVKPGGVLTVTYEGKEYTLEIVAIDRTNFTLRLNREEFTRPIK